MRVAIVAKNFKSLAELFVNTVAPVWAHRLQEERQLWRELVDVPIAEARTVVIQPGQICENRLGVGKNFYNCVGVHVEEKIPGGGVLETLLHYNTPENSSEVLGSILKGRYPRKDAGQLAVMLILNTACASNQSGPHRQHVQAMYDIENQLGMHGIVPDVKLTGANHFAVGKGRKVTSKSFLQNILGDEMPDDDEKLSEHGVER
jgi:hypothetical protein